MLHKYLNSFLQRAGKKLRYVCPMLVRKLQFFRLFKRPVNLKNPVFFSEKIMQRMKEINKLQPDTREYARINQKNNRCKRTLDDLCNHVRKMPTFID